MVGMMGLSQIAGAGLVDKLKIGCEDVKVEKGGTIRQLEVAPDGRAPFFMNYREILGSCFFSQFTLGVDVPELQADALAARQQTIVHCTGMLWAF